MRPHKKKSILSQLGVLMPCVKYYVYDPSYKASSKMTMIT